MMGSLFTLRFDNEMRGIRVKRSREIQPDENVYIYRFESNVQEVIIPLDDFVSNSYAVCIDATLDETVDYAHAILDKDTVDCNEDVSNLLHTNFVTVQTNMEIQPQNTIVGIDGLCQEIIADYNEQIIDYDHDNKESMELTCVSKDDLHNQTIHAETFQVQIVTEADMLHEQGQQQTCELQEPLHESVLTVNYEPMSVDEEKVDTKLVESSSNSFNINAIGDKCPYCEYRNKYNCYLRRHIWTHAPNDAKPFACQLCPMKYNTNARLKHHMYKHTQEKPFKCELCEYCTSDRALLSRHSKQHAKSSENAVACEICGRKFLSEGSLKHHINASHKSKCQYRCTECNLSFINRLALQKHNRQHGIHNTWAPVKKRTYPKSTFPCETCGSIFLTKGALFKHNRTHIVVADDAKAAKRSKKFEVLKKCDLCEHEFRSARDLTQHMESVHSNEKPYRCEVCDHRASTRNYLMIHMRTHLPESERPFKCEQCPSAFNDKRCLDSHMNKHTGEKPFACDLCDQRFSSKQTLTGHKRTHLPADQRPHKCEHCTRTFSKRRGLIFHIANRHGGEKSLECAHCDFRTANRGTLKTHVLIHLENRESLVCGSCGTSYRSTHKKYFQEHVEKCKNNTFSCSECDYRTKNKKNLSTHVLSHLPEGTLIKCEHCECRFTNKIGLVKHIKTCKGQPIVILPNC